MYKIGLQMLTQDKAKFLGLILSLSFSALIITQQTAIFLGLMIRTYSVISDTTQAQIWVMDPNVKMIDDIKPLRDTDLFRIRSIDGVKWAVPFFKGLIRARLSDGHFQTCILLGIDSATLIGGPAVMLEGDIFNLRMPDAVIVDDYELSDKLSVQNSSDGRIVPLGIGDALELNDQRAVVVGICRLKRTFATQPVVYTTYDRALQYSPYERKLQSFVLVKADDAVDPHELCKKITAETGFLALTKEDFENKTYMYYMKNTGIPINFGLAVFLGVLIGAAIAGQIFFYFISDNLPYFALLSVMGASKILLARMTMLQGLLVAILSWHIGTGSAALIGYFAKETQLSFYLPWSLYFATGLIIILICLGAALIGISRIYSIELGEVFKQ